jgi:hypothetical protein
VACLDVLPYRLRKKTKTGGLRWASFGVEKATSWIEGGLEKATHPIERS